MKNSRLAFICLWAIHLITTTAINNEYEPPNFNRFVVTWFPSFRLYQTRSNNALASDFYIQGLWPTNETGYSIELCHDGFIQTEEELTGMIFEEGKVSRTEMNLFWPNINANQPNDKVWHHEWNTHGSCFSGQLDAWVYFNKALELRNTWDLVAMLSLSDITPGPTLYHLSHIQGAISYAMSDNKINVVVKCQKQNDVILLNEIHICVDGAAENAISCTEEDDDMCDPNSAIANIQFPP